jgi:3-deoxy-D-manno-octulosonic-acid transferase
VNTGAAVSAMAARAVVVMRPVVGFVRPDLGREISERVAAEQELVDWGEGRAAEPLVWVHGASAGELLGVVPAIRELRERSDFTLLVTHFSPSGRASADRLLPDFVSLPPIDVPERCGRVLAAARPDLLVFARGDVWPGLVDAATDRGVRTALVNGVVRSGSNRLRWPARPVFRRTYEALDGVGAASEEDAGRLRVIGVRAEALRITGDASFDQALERARTARAPGGSASQFESALPRRPDVGRRLIAGSTWERDETALLDALESLPATAGGRFGWQLVIVPHKPDEPTVRRLLGECGRRGHPAARWTDRAAVEGLPSHGVLVFDEMGMLAELYAAGDVAYVGGGLGTAGLHNVLEPAAAGVPVLFGPRHDRRDAAELVAVGGGFISGPEGFASTLERLSDPAARAAAGRAAGRYVSSQAGAARATADLLEGLLRG